MAWTGYIGLGTISGGVFTELSPVGYARQPFTFGNESGGTVAGVGQAITFPVVTGGTAWSHDALAFYAGLTGGTPTLVYPHVTPGMTVAPGTAQFVQPSRVVIDLLASTTHAGAAVSPSQAATVAGTPIPLTPAQAFGVPRRWCVVGDSYIARNGSLIGGNETNMTMLGGLEALKVFSRQAFVLNLADIFGQSGGTLVDVIAKLPAIVAGGYAVCVVQGCHNDFIAGMSLATVQANYRLIIATLLSANIVPVIVLGPPIDSNESSAFITLDQCRKMTLAANAWKRQYCSSIGVLTWDWSTPLTDVSSTGGGYGAGMSVDTIHPSLKGGMATGKQAVIDLAPLLTGPTLSQLSSGILDVIDPSNPAGCLGPSGLFWAGGGTVSSQASGTAPLGYFIGRQGGAATGGTVASSLVASADGIGQWWQLAVSGATAGGTTGEGVTMTPFGVAVTMGPTTYAIGDQIESWLEVNVLANSPFFQIKLILKETNKDGSTVIASCGPVTPSGESTGPAYAWSGIFRTPVLTVPADSTGAGSRTLQPTFVVKWDGSGNNFSGTLQIRRWSTRKVLS